RHCGIVTANEAADIRTVSFNNSQNGGIVSGAVLALVADLVDNSQNCRITAKGAIYANLKWLDQQGSGRRVSDTAIALDLRGGELVNRAQGLIATPGALLLRQLGVVDNSGGGEISSDQSFTLATTALSNRGGRVISGDSLTLRI
ncbi:hypothetical protein ACV347_30685, partial [Pseudomonas aeruginosa]